MTNMTNAITNTVSISMFNRGLAGKVFEDVKKCGAKVQAFAQPTKHHNIFYEK